jgi:hypothetical protein
MMARISATRTGPKNGIVRRTFKPDCRRAVASPEGIEHHSIVAPQLDVFESLTATQYVVGDVQHVVGLVIWLVYLEHPDVGIDRFRQPDPADHSLNRAHSTVRDPARPNRQLVLDVAAPQHRPSIVHCHRSLQSPLNFPLLTCDSLSYHLLHSKSSFSCFFRS